MGGARGKASLSQAGELQRSGQATGRGVQRAGVLVHEAGRGHAGRGSPSMEHTGSVTPLLGSGGDCASEDEDHDLRSKWIV